MKAEQWTKAKSLYLAGKTWKAISSDLGLNQSTLLSKASREGLPKVRKEMRNTVSSKETVSLESLSALVRSKLAQDAAATLERVNGYALDGIRDEGTREQILGSVAKRSALVFGWSETGEAPQVSVNISPMQFLGNTDIPAWCAYPACRSWKTCFPSSPAKSPENRKNPAFREISQVWKAAERGGGSSRLRTRPKKNAILREAKLTLRSEPVRNRGVSCRSISADFQQ